MQYEGTPTYNANRLKIHYLPIPYAADSEIYIYNDAEIANVNPTTIDFTGSLANTEPCVRTTFYNDGVGQYGYIVDSDQEEQHMVIANAMLQDTHGDTADLGMLDPAHLDNVYFDLYSKDYTADSWRRDDRITAKDLVAQITADNLNNSTLHKTDTDVAFQVDTSKLSIFASRFVNSINARFLDSVFLDDLTLADIPAHSIDWKDKHADLLSHSAFDNVSASNKSKSTTATFTLKTITSPPITATKPPMPSSMRTITASSSPSASTRPPSASTLAPAPTSSPSRPTRPAS